MKLIAGLGNPGQEYAETRHNIGFILLDALAEKWGADFQEKPRFRALIAETELEGERILLVKPTTFYNLTGEAIHAVRDFYKLANRDILVIHDDLALPFGTVRTRLGGSDAGNNGVKSLNQHLGEDYARVRVGVWSEHREHITATDFVLGKLSAVQTKLLREHTDDLAEICTRFIKSEFTPHTFTLEN